MVEHGEIDRAGNVIGREFGGAAHVDAIGIIRELGDADAIRRGVPLAHRGFPGGPSSG